MKKQVYFTKDKNLNLVEVDDQLANDILKQYFERRYIGAIVIGSFIIGFLLGVIAYAL
jgi:hypothetical protein